LKLNKDQKDKLNEEIRENTKAAEKRSKLLRNEGFPDTGANRMKLRIWEELNPANPLDRRCPYCGEPIGMQALLSGEADIDHILPYSRTLDDSVSNKVISYRHCNRQKGNKTPWERWGETDRWAVISDQVARLHKGKQWRFQPDAMKRFEEEGGFIQRQLVDTQYLSRMTGRYLSSLYPDKEYGSVYVIPGRMTAMLRRLWGLNTLLPDHNIVDNEHSNAPKNRLDHRHHAIDAAVVAVTTRGLLQQVAKAAGRAEGRDLDRMFKDLAQPWEGFRKELRTKVLRVTVSHKADHGLVKAALNDQQQTAAQLHNETAYGLTDDVNSRDISIVRYRVALQDLKPKDLTDPNRIIDAKLRTELDRATNGLTGKDFQKALSEFARLPGPYQGIRRVRLRKPLAVISIRDKTGKAYKGYQGDSNSRYDVWRLPDGKWIHVVISTFDIHQANFDDLARRPHPSAKKILSLRQNDLIAIEKDGGPRQIMRFQKFRQNGQISLVEHNETGDMAKRNKDPDDPFKFFEPSAGKLRKMNARQVRVDPLGRVFDPGPHE